MWTAAQENDKDARINIEKGAWRALAESFGGTRAAWVSKETKPASIDVNTVESLLFPDQCQARVLLFGGLQTLILVLGWIVMPLFIQF